MNQKLAINLVLLVLVLGLGVLLFGPQQTPTSIQLAPLTSRSPDTLRSMQVGYPDGALARFERQGPDAPWQMTKPWQMPANQSHLNTLARLVEAPVFDSFALDEQRRAEFGFDKALKLRLDDMDIAFGTTNPLNNHRYLLKDGQVLLLVDRFYHLLMAGPASLVSPALLPPGASIESLEGPGFRLHKTDSGWQLTPAHAALSTENLSHSILAWQEAQGLGVRHFQGLDDAGPKQSWRLVLGDGQELVFLLQETKGEQWLVRKDNGLGYQIPKDSPVLRMPGASLAGTPLDE